MPRPKLAALYRPLPINFEFCLAATVFFLWCLAGGFQAQIGISFERFRLVVETPQWLPSWPVLPWLLGAGGLALAYARYRWGSLSPGQLGQHLRQLRLLAAALLLLRLGTLWSPLTALFPYLTLLWSPHLSWALAALFLLFPHAGALPALSRRKTALVLMLGSAAILSLWSLYFCQMTMLHGDEAHYLRVTQSLLHDGDMDLSNNLGLEQVKEYHIVDFSPHKAPGSPPGKIHSVHPIGLSALLLPAYWTGLQLWANPRLACNLLMVWLSAGVIALTFLWLVGLGLGQWQALACTLVGASTTPFFLYTTQLYPEIPALFIAQCCLVLLVHWQSPAPGYRSLGKGEPWILAGLILLLIGLLFLHPRYLPLAAFLGTGIGLQAWHSPQRRQALRWCLPLAGAGGLAIAAFNYDYSGDLFGPFLPGNAWDQGALQASTLLFSLPGQWLHETTGLLNSSPVFLASLLGLVFLALERGPRRWGVLAYYLATAGANGLHPDWTFGFCLPTRFLLTALPVLLLGLALFLERFSRRVVVLLLLLFALTLSYDGVIQIAAMPEQGYGGSHLSVRTLGEYYPLDVHFFSQTTGSLPWASLLFWVLAIAGLAVALLPRLKPPWRWAALLVAALLPFGLTERLNASASPYLLQLNPAGDLPTGVQFFNRPIHNEYQMTTGRALKPAGFGAQAPPDPAGILKSYYAPLIQPGVNYYLLSGVQAENEPGQVAGHFIVGQRQTLPAISDWGIFRAAPIASSTAAAVKTVFYSDSTSLDYVFVEFAGAGSLAFTEVQNRFLPVHFASRREELRRFPGSDDPGATRLGTRCDNLDKGYYLARFELKGTAFGTFFARKPDPVFLAVYAAQNSPPDAPPLEVQATRWLKGYYPVQDPTLRPDFIRPMVERVQAPWWTALPLVGDSAYELEFSLSQAQEVWLLFDYPGDAGLKLAGITLYRQQLSAAGMGE